MVKLSLAPLIPTDIVLDGSMQALLTEAKDTLGFNEGEYTMFVADQPSVPPSMPSVVIMAKANTNQQTVTERQHILGSCEILDLNRTDQAEVYPVIAANAYFAIAANDYPKAHDAKIIDGTEKITIIQQPKHGLLEPTNSDGDWADTRYLPSNGYLGNDSFILQVEGSGYKVKVHYFLLVTDAGGPQVNPACKTPGYWKISTPDANGNSTLTAVDYLPTLTSDSTPVTDATTLASILGAEKRGQGPEKRGQGRINCVFDALLIMRA